MLVVESNPVLASSPSWQGTENATLDMEKAGD